MTLSHGARELRAWMDRKAKNQQWLAEQLTKARDGRRVHQSSVSAWLRGAQVPLWAALALKRIAGISIEAWTVGEDARAS